MTTIHPLRLRPEQASRRKLTVDPLAPQPVARLERLRMLRFPTTGPFRPIVLGSELLVHVIDPPVPTVVPQPVGDTLLLVDAANRRVHHRLLEPAPVSGAVTVTRRAVDLQTTGGNLSLTVRCHHDPDPVLRAARTADWTTALEQAGHGGGPWTFVPLELQTVAGELTLPDGHLAGPVTSTASPQSGIVTFLAPLSAAGAFDLQRALATGSPGTVTGLCSVRATAIAGERTGTGVVRLDDVLVGPLATLLRGLGPDALRYVDPRTSVEARILVAPYEGVSTVLLEARSRSRGTAVTETLGPAGGELVCAVTADDLAREAVDWTATITFVARSWPPIRLTGELSAAAASWATIVTPGSWVRRLTLFASVHDASGKVVEPAEGDTVVGEIRHEAGFIDGGALVQTFGLAPGALTGVDYPSPRSAEPTATRLTVRSVRSGALTVATRALGELDTMIGVRVAADGRATITTNTDPAGEEAGLAGAQVPTRPEETMRPRITGPARWAATSEPPEFEISTDGQPYWMVELATDPALMGSGSGTDGHYFGSDVPLVFGTGGRWPMPQEVWDDLGPAGTIYYRVFASERDDGFVDWTVSVDDGDEDLLPAVVVGDGAGGAVATGSATADVAALCAYLAVTPERFALDEDRYFARLGELLAFHGAVGDAAEVGPATFRDAVARFQRDAGLAVDGLPGQDTAWALNLDWATQRGLQLVDVEADRWTPPGAARHDDDRHGYGFWRVRSDVADAIAGLRAELTAAGVALTSAGGLRPLSAAVTAGRSATSIHYSGVAADLATVSGMAASGSTTAADLLYVVTRDGARWRVWARSDDGEQAVLDAVEWSGGATSTRRVAGRFLDLTQAAQRYGFAPIGPRSSFPADYLSAEWWHLQHEASLVPWISQFGAEILSVAGYAVADLQARQALWDNRKRMFQRGRDGWW